MYKTTKALLSISLFAALILSNPTNPAQAQRNATGQTNVKDQGITVKDSRGKSVSFPLGAASFADRVVGYQPTGSIPEKASKPESALGLPDYRSVGDGTYVALGNNGKLTLQFTDNYLVDVEGPDLWVFEIGPQVEPTHVAISKDGQEWIHVGTVKGGTEGIDIGPKVQPGDRFSYVMLIDANAKKSRDGADIDAVGAIGSIAREEFEEEPLSASNSSDCPELRIEMNDGLVYQFSLNQLKKITTEPAARGKKGSHLRVELNSGTVHFIDLSHVAQMTPVPAS